MRPTSVANKAAVTAGQPTNVKPQVKATNLSGPELKPPIDYLELGSGFKAAILPPSVAADFAGAKISSDKSELTSLTSGDSVWIQGFSTKASDSNITVYYSGMLGVKGFVGFEPGPEKTSGKRFQAKRKVRGWRSSDKRYEVYVYDTGETAAPVGQTEARPIYVVEVHDRASGAKGSL
jgi:hypothetical protein